MSQKNIQEFFSKRAKLIDTPCTSATVVSELGTSTTPNETSKLPTDKNTEDRASTSLVRERRIVSNNMDLGLYVSTFNKPELIGSVLSSPWTPDASYVFPSISPKNLRFQRSWFERFPWLVYSDVLEGALCKFCVLFGTTANRGLQNKQCLGKLVRQAHSNWKHAIEHYNKHQNNEYHKTSITMAENFVRINESEQSIDKQLDSHKRKIAKANRDKLVPVIESIVFCRGQGIALRGHRDDGQISIQQPIENDGNFRSLLRYRASYDGELLNQLNDGPANASYISKTIQNELINCIGVSIQQQIVKSVNSAKCFSILADETTDISAIEQLTICARYIGDDAKMKEDFLCFVPLVKMDAESISTKIIEELRKLNLDLQYLRGQGYDGASVMRGHLGGVNVKIKEKLGQNVLYVHCSSHALNLVLSHSCSLPEIRNAMGTLGEIVNFFNTPKRMDVLKTIVAEQVHETKRQKLISYCDTRFIQRHDAIFRFVELYDFVVEAFEEIQRDFDSKTSSKAMQFLAAMKTPSFLVGMYIAENVLSSTVWLSKELQSPEIDLAAAIDKVDEISTYLQIQRNQCNEEFSKIWSAINDRAGEQGITIEVPRQAKRQTQRSNVPSSTPEEYYRRSVYVPFLDHVLSELE